MSRTFAARTDAAREKAADHAASQLTTQPSRALADHRSERPGDPQASFEAVREPMEAALGGDFSRVRIHASGTPSHNARQLGARALTYGNQVAFAPGEWAPGTWRGMNLLAHELAHVAMQSREGARRLDAKPLDQEIDDELAKRAASDPKSLDPTNEGYATALQSYGHDLTHKNMTDLIDEPTLSAEDAKKPKKKAQYERDKAEWRRKFQKSEILAGRILDNSGANVFQKEERAQMLASDLATAGFVTEAMALARRFRNDNIRRFVFDAALDRPDKITSAQLVEITKFYLAKKTMADHPVAVKLADSGVYSRRLPADAVNAVLTELATAYSADADFPRAIAEILFFDDRIRAGFTTTMIQKKQGSLLRRISEQPHFAAGGQVLTTQGTTLTASDPAVAWAVANKQKVTVEEIVALVTAAGGTVTRPVKHDAGTLRSWLEANTEKIGAALRKQHPDDPAVAETMLRNITTSFMWHVDPTAEDIAPDRSGRITKLPAASGGQKAQLKVDCDVLATYNVRLLVAAGFTPIGYMAVMPTDAGRAPHAMALVQHGKTYRALSNVETINFPVTTKEDALKRLRDFGIREAYDPKRPLQGYKIYYQDSDAKGALPAAVLNADAAALASTLSKTP